MFQKKNESAKLPMNYDTYVFDLYGTLVDIHTEEGDRILWEKLALFYGYYDALYDWEELKNAYENKVRGKEQKLKMTLEEDPHYSHEASPEIEITEVFAELYREKGVEADEALAVQTGQFFRVLSTEYVRVYPGTEEMLAGLKQAGKKVYLLSNAQRIFTEYEMHVLGIAKYFDDIFISSDFQTKKPDKRFYDALISKHQIDVSRALFVGNDSKTDIAGARSVDMDTFYVYSNISPKNDMAKDANYVVKNFTSWSF